MTEPAERTRPASAPSLRLAVAPVTDLERSIAFYTAALGLTVERRVEFPGLTEVSMAFPGGGAGLLLVKAGPGAPHASGAPARIVLHAPDARGLGARIAAAGYALERPVEEVAEFKVLVGIALDPDGNIVEFVQFPG
jgi:catechol 2,3-dioxygenase-like lactoylglutathione lyase family enzyme